LAGDGANGFSAVAFHNPPAAAEAEGLPLGAGRGSASLLPAASAKPHPTTCAVAGFARAGVAAKGSAAAAADVLQDPRHIGQKSAREKQQLPRCRPAQRKTLRLEGLQRTATGWLVIRQRGWRSSPLPEEQALLQTSPHGAPPAQQRGCLGCGCARVPCLWQKLAQTGWTCFAGAAGGPTGSARWGWAWHSQSAARWGTRWLIAPA
jgi:hypothetical protein